MNIDLNLIPSTFDAVHAALATTVVGLFCLQILLLLFGLFALYRKNKQPVAAPVQPVATPAAVHLPERTIAVVKEQPIPKKETGTDAALQFLALLQQEARFVDFMHENVASYSDQEIGAAARVVHEGCSKILRQYFDIKPIYDKPEGSSIMLDKGFDASSVRLTGNVVGSAPFTGTLVHRGYKVTRCELPHPTPGHDAHILAAAEVEL